MEENKKRPVSKKRIALIIVCCLLALILVVLLGTTILFRGLLGQIGRVEESQNTLSSEQMESILGATDSVDPEFTGPELNGDEVTMPTGPAETIPVADDVISFLLVGQDRREGQGRQRSDSMILCTINKTDKTLTMTSFLRDLWVQIPGRYNERLNVPYVIGGFGLLNETLQYNFGVSADHNIEVDFSGFEKIIDLVGGVDIELTKAEANYMIKKNVDWELVEGVNHLSGKQALFYSRIRAIGNDFGRTNRQRTVLTALLDKASTLNWLQLYPLINGILPMITTDMTDAQILGYIRELAPILPELKIVSQRIPADNAYAFARIDGKSVIVLSPQNLEKNLQILRDTIGQ